MDGRPVSESATQLARLMGVGDANNAGNVHGGTVMKLADEAAALAAIKHSGCRVVTAGMDRVDFLVPIDVGQLVTFKAMVNAAWRTSKGMPDAVCPGCLRGLCPRAAVRGAVWQRWRASVAGTHRSERAHHGQQLPPRRRPRCNPVSARLCPGFYRRARNSRG